MDGQFGGLLGFNGMSRQFQKTVDITKVDEDERTATGYVLIPNELDHQADFFRPAAVRNFYAEAPDTGVMHAAFPEGAAETVESTIIDEPDEVDGETFPAGSWRYTRKYHDDELWGLVRDEIVSAFSIGGVIADAAEHGSVPGDVRHPDGVERAEDEPVTELIDGETHEISDVDLPAVPRATHKGEQLGKNILEDTDSKAEFIEVMQERGRSESEAERLYDYLTTHAESGEKTDSNHEQMTDDTPDDATKWRRFKSWLKTDSVDEGDGAPDTITLSKATIEAATETLSKEGRTLNSTNRQALMAAHDAIESALATDTTFRTNRFTDNPQFAFDVAEYGTANPSHPDPEPDDEEDEEDRAGEDKPDDEDEDMTEETDETEEKSEEPPEWAKSLIDDVEQLKNEQTDDAEKADDDGEEMPEWAKSLKDDVEALKTQGGQSQQLSGGSVTETDSEGGADFGDALIGKIAAEAGQ